jgi:hypothetical protein
MHRFAAEFVREIAAEDLRWKVASLLSAQRAPDGNPIVRHGAHRGWDILSAFLAADREIALPGLRKIEHEMEYRRTKGENTMWISLDSSSLGDIAKG